MNCPICNNPQTLAVMQSHDDRYGYPGKFTLRKCQKSGHKFLDCALSPSELTDLYTNYYPRKSLAIESYRPHTEQSGFSAWFDGLRSSAFRWVPKNVRVLDVGCGFGQSLGYHASRGCDVYGVEADENIRRVVEKYGFKVHVGLFDDKIYSPEFFDFVTMDQVIEHVNDPVKTLSGISRILKSGGTVILSTPNACGWGARLFGRRWINWHSPYHLQFFSPDSMRQAASRAGLALSKVHTITNSEWLLYQWIHLLIFPKPGQASPFWAPNQKRTLMHSVWIRLLYMIHRTKFNHIITRLFDAFGYGDNYIFVLKKP